MIFETDFMKLYEELSEINSDTDLESIVNAVATEVEKYDKDGSNQNCLFSTWAVELQLRGEDFLPRPVYSPRDPIFDIKGEELVFEPEVLKISSKEDVETQVLDAGDGARFYCHVNWAGSKGGHEFLLINDNDSILVVDGQAGYIKEINKDKKYFDDINFENSYIVRLDNKEINQDVLKYNDEDQIVEWDDDLDLKLLEEDFSNNNDFLQSLLDELSDFDYAFIDADGEELDDEEAMKAVVQSPDQLEALGKGVCTDFVEYTRIKLDERNISYKVYDIACTDKDGDHPAHVFVVVETEGKFLWLEAAWHSEAGIHEYDSLEELFEDIARKHCIYDGENYLDSCEIREIKKSLVGMSQEAIYDYVNTLPITWKAVEEGITESLKQIDYLPVSDVELFKEYADDILDGYGNMSDANIKSAIKEIHFEGRLAGYIGFSEYEENGHKCLGIGNFMIIERGKGLGSAVIQNIVEKYKNQYDLIYCFVDAKNDGAIRLYKKLGKVYDEDGPNNNGEYYVTFWDNGKWDLDEEFDPPYNEQQVKSNYGEETYQRLIKDPAHLWRMRTGIELIHKEPSKKELERIWANWQLMSDKQKLISDKKSIQLFGKTNAENYSELIKLYDGELNEGKKNKKVASVTQTKEIDLDSFLKDIGLVPISTIAPACSSTSPSGATVWAPAEPHSGGSYKKAIPQFEVISTKRLPKLVATLDDTEFPSKMFTTDDIQNNGGRKLKEVRIGDVQNNPCRGLWFRTRSGNKRYFIFGSIFYKNTQKINAATNSEVTQANKIYDAIMKKLGNF